MQKELTLNWIGDISDDENRFILQEYRFLVHRFTQWIGLTMSKSENETVRQLILPNFVEECGTIGGAKSHLQMLDNLLHSVGIRNILNYTPTATTREIEGQFFNTFDNGNIYKSLCVLGPATEAISGQFLLPLKSITARNFPKANTEYFDVHLSEVEDQHAIDIDKAIHLMENIDSSLLLEKQDYIVFGFKLHKEFWEQLSITINSQYEQFSIISG